MKLPQVSKDTINEAREEIATYIESKITDEVKHNGTVLWSMNGEVCQEIIEELCHRLEQTQPELAGYTIFALTCLKDTFEKVGGLNKPAMAALYAQTLITLASVSLVEVQSMNKAAERMVLSN
jgi:1,6-anhydro-N-acetylmuramate kinase